MSDEPTSDGGCLALFKLSGMLPHERMEDPKLGLLISPAGVHKLQSSAPPTMSQRGWESWPRCWHSRRSGLSNEQ